MNDGATTDQPSTETTRWKLILEFDGTEFFGWQRQREGRTVQGELERALSTFVGYPVKVTGQGRTDRGVHAERQVVHADIADAVGKRRLLAAMRGLLPPDMAVIDAVKQDETFHARFSARSRIYRYRLVSRPSPLNRRMCWVVLQPPDPDLLFSCAALIRGTHDFTNFTRLTDSGPKHCLCTIARSEWIRDGVYWNYTIEGNRFLRHMVRRLVGSMVHVALGKMSIDQFSVLMEGSASVESKGYSAPPEGLVLADVIY